MFLTVFHCFSKGESIFRSFAHKKTNDSLEKSIQYKYIFVYSCYSQGPLHRSWDFYFMYNILQDAGIWTELLHISLQWATHIPITFLYYTYFSA